jgi:hypothetical protein
MPVDFRASAFVYEMPVPPRCAMHHQTQAYARLRCGLWAIAVNCGAFLAGTGLASCKRHQMLKWL